MAARRRTKERTERIELRCTPSERQAWEAEAATQGWSLSALIRRTLAKPRAICAADPTLARQIAAIGNNLNQVARWVNIHKEGIEARLVLAELQHMRRELLRLAEDASC